MAGGAQQAGGPATAPCDTPTKAEQRKVIIASTLGTLFEWYDFFLYGTLAALLASKFFPADNPTAGLLASLAAFGAGFGVRPLGAVVFGYLGDLVGRKYTFLITITIMGMATVLVGALPTYATAGVLAPVLLVILRLAQGLALGGEYGGAVIYVAEHAPQKRRGLHTSWIQASAVGGFLLSLMVVVACRFAVGEEAFSDWGWRLPFLLSFVMLVISVYIRTTLNESPVFRQMKAEGRTAKNPLKESLADRANLRRIFVAMFGVTAGLTVIWYTSQFSAMFFLQGTARLPSGDVYFIMVTALVIALPSFVLFGWLSDIIGRKTLLVAGYVLALLFLKPLYVMMTEAANPALAAAMERAPVRVAGTDCDFDVFAKTQATPCAAAIAHLTARGVSYDRTDGAGAAAVAVTIGDAVVESADAGLLDDALVAAGYPLAADPAAVRHGQVIALIIVMTLLAAMTYAPAAALLVEMFPARVRYTSMSLPYHVGAGYVGGFLPFIAQYIVVTTGDVYAGLWYTLGVVVFALVLAVFFLPETKDRTITD